MLLALRVEHLVQLVLPTEPSIELCNAHPIASTKGVRDHAMRLEDRRVEKEDQIRSAGWMLSLWVLHFSLAAVSSGGLLMRGRPGSLARGWVHALPYPVVL